MFSIAILHIFWALGRKLFLDYALPEIKGRKIKPDRILTLLVAAALFGAGFVLLGLNRVLVYPIPFTWIYWGRIFWAAVFLARGIGGWFYIGLLGHLKNTKFGKMDTILYSPLCIFLGAVFY
jgi:hypothetical protein